jgi:hypothetical protein
MLRVVARHVNQLSIHQFMIAREVVGDPLEIVDRQPGTAAMNLVYAHSLKVAGGGTHLRCLSGVAGAGSRGCYRTVAVALVTD